MLDFCQGQLYVVVIAMNLAISFTWVHTICNMHKDFMHNQHISAFLVLHDYLKGLLLISLRCVLPSFNLIFFECDIGIQMFTKCSHEGVFGLV